MTIRFFKALALGLVLGLTGLGEARASDDLGFRIYTKAGTFAEVREDLQDAIVKRGFVIDYVGHFNDMLERTAVAAGSVTKDGNKSPYREAQYLQFCPAAITHEEVSASPFAIANCPVAVFVYELKSEPAKVHVGFRLPVGSPSRLVKKINDKLVGLLHDIATEATK
ncbi:MAG: DUF302 domain-containing protein [Hyphomicrobiaceae bacterium]|jgi:hypothetical protein